MYGDKLDFLLLPAPQNDLYWKGKKTLQHNTAAKYLSLSENGASQP